MKFSHGRHQRGIALPITLIILVIMLISGAYLFKSSNSATLTTSNLAYEASLKKAADLGLMIGFEWLNATATANKIALNSDDATGAYVASLDTTLTTRSPAFWNGSKQITDSAGNQIEYVIHRLCSRPLPFDDQQNHCVQTSANTATLNNSVALGSSLSSTAIQLADSPQLHYVVTARIFGPRGGNVINQSVVMIGV